jgi:hypothetical protein
MAAAAPAVAGFCRCGHCRRGDATEVCCRDAPWVARGPREGCVTTSDRFVAHLDDGTGRLRKTGAVPLCAPAYTRVLTLGFCGAFLQRARAHAGGES